MKRATQDILNFLNKKPLIMKNMNLSIPALSKRQMKANTSFFQKAKDVVTLKPFRELFSMDFNFELNRKDLMEIHEQMYP